MSPLPRLYTAAFLTDAALYLLLGALPWKALELGASSLVLGALPACSLSIYILSAATMGRRSDRLPRDRTRLRQAQLGLLLFALAACALSRGRSLPALAISVAPVGLGLGFFWPAVQATLADLTPGWTGRALGRFNIAWSLGKAGGYFAGGLLVRALGPDSVFLCAAVLGVVVAWVLPVRTGPAAAGARDASPGSPQPAEGFRDPAHVSRFRRMAWLINLTAFGIGATLGSQYPKWLAVLGHGAMRYGLVLALVTAAQTLAFVLLSRYPGWQWRRMPLLAVLCAAGGAAMLLGWVRSLAVVLPAAILIGVGLGSAYHASIHYSVYGHERRGRHAGMHESLQASGALAVPVVAGGLADATGALGVPYLFAGGLLLVVTALGGWVWRPRSKAQH